MNKEKYRSAMDKIKADQKYQEHLVDTMLNGEAKPSHAKAWLTPVLAVCGLCLCVALGYTFVKTNHILIPVSEGTAAQNTASLTVSSAAAEAGAPEMAAGGAEAAPKAAAQESDEQGMESRGYDGGLFVEMQTLYVDGRIYEPNRFNLNWNTSEKCMRFQGDYAGEIKKDLRSPQDTVADSWSGYYPKGSKIYNVEGLAEGSAYLVVEPDGSATVTELSSVQEDLTFQEAVDLFVLEKEEEPKTAETAVYEAQLYTGAYSDDFTILYEEMLLRMFDQMGGEKPLAQATGTPGQPLVLYLRNGGRAVTYVNLQTNTLELLGKEYSLPKGFSSSCARAVEQATKECRPYSLKELLGYPENLKDAGVAAFRLTALWNGDELVLEAEGERAGELAEEFFGGAFGKYRFYSPVGLCGNTEINEVYRLELTRNGKTDVLEFITLDGGNMALVKINGVLYGTNEQWLSTGEIWQFFMDNSR